MSINDGSNRPRFLDNMKAALAPREPIKIDPDAPNPVPRTVKVAGWLSIVAGLINFGLGILALFQREPIIQSVIKNVAECKAEGVGVGAAVTTTDTSDFITLCKSLGDYTAADYDAARSSFLTTAIILLVVGAAGMFAGYGVTRGARWARMLMTAIGVLLLIATMLQILSSPLILLAALIMIVGLALCYVGKGAAYYIRAKAKGVK